jgi:hypothetical protein
VADADPTQELGAQAGTGEAGAEPQDGSEQPRARRDKAPRKRAKRSSTAAGSSKGQPRGAVLKQQTKRLEDKLGELLTFPAMPAAMFAPDAATQGYMIEHFTRSGPRTAAILAEASESNEQLRALLERVTSGGSMFTVVLALVTYTAPPVMWTIGMRQQAASVTQASTMSEQELATIMAAANAAAAQESQSAEAPQGAEHAGANGAQGAEAADAGAGAELGEPPA